MCLATSAVPGYGMWLRPIAMVEQLASPGEGNLRVQMVVGVSRAYCLSFPATICSQGQSCRGVGRAAGAVAGGQNEGLWGQQDEGCGGSTVGHRAGVGAALLSWDGGDAPSRSSVGHVPGGQ